MEGMKKHRRHIFDEETCAMALDEYAEDVLEYDCITQLFNDKQNALGKKYVPNLQQLGINLSQ